jgi:hypothetical protein
MFVSSIVFRSLSRYILVVSYGLMNIYIGVMVSAIQCIDVIKHKEKEKE